MADRKRGWHATMTHAPRRGMGTATVDPIRDTKDIGVIKGTLAHRPRDLALFVLGIHLGLRGGDLLRLRWRDVLGVDRRLLTRVVVTEQKTGKQRSIALQENAKKALQGWLQVVGIPELDKLIFPSANGGPLTIQRLHQLVREWTRESGVEGRFGTHTLRKTYGFQLRSKGVDIVTLMTVFGHSSQKITLRYIGIEQGEIDEANLKLNL